MCMEGGLPRSWTLNGKKFKWAWFNHQFTIGVEALGCHSWTAPKALPAPDGPEALDQVFCPRMEKEKISRPQSGNFWGNFSGGENILSFARIFGDLQGITRFFFSNINYLIFLVFSDEQRGSCDDCFRTTKQMSKLIGGWALARWVEVFFASSNIKHSPI